ncbi:N-acetyltransferase [Herbaspirillum sp. HC18]|nr:N-acetyltransferase [Herbaspirillum sp. HC18]
MSGATLRNNTGKHRYELVDGDEVVGFADYRLTGNETVFVHTEVAAGHEGKGYGSALAKQALDDVVAQNRKIVAQCEFIAAYLNRHPEYAASVKKQ